MCQELQEGAGLGQWGHRGPCPTAGSCAGVGQWHEAACQIPVCSLTKAGNPFWTSCLLPQVRRAALSIFHAQGQTFPPQQQRAGLAHGCSAPVTGSSTELAPAVPAAVCLTPGMDGRMAAVSFSLSFPRISHVLCYLVVTSCRLTCRYDPCVGRWRGNRKARNLY